jgi:predicted RNase H-like nuclease (RuvC/YqgF family)
MASKRPTRGSAGPAWQILLEDIRSQNRATIEAVLTAGERTNARIDRVEQEMREGFTLLGVAVRQNSSDIRELKRDVSELKRDVSELKQDVSGLKQDVSGLKTDVARLTVEMSVVSSKVDRLVPLEQRVIALENRPS